MTVTVQILPQVVCAQSFAQLIGGFQSAWSLITYNFTPLPPSVDISRLMLHGPVQYDVTAVLTSLTLQASLTTFLMLLSLLLLLMSPTSPLLIKSFQLLMFLLLLMSFLPVAVLTLMLSLLVPLMLQQTSPAVAGALPAARTPPVVDVHAWMLAVAVNENAELAPLLLLSFLLWMGLPAGALRSTVCIFPTLGSRPWFPPLVPGPGSHLWFPSWFPSLVPALVPIFGSRPGSRP